VFLVWGEVAGAGARERLVDVEEAHQMQKEKEI
jgi:hypothetical protein